MPCTQEPAGLGHSHTIVIVMVITAYHAVHWDYRTSRTDTWFVPCSIPWVVGLPAVAHCMTEDPQDRGYRRTTGWGRWQLQSVSVSNGDERWLVGSPGVKGQGIALQQHSNQEKARALPMGAMQQPINKAPCVRRSKSSPPSGCPSLMSFDISSPRPMCTLQPVS